MMFTLCLAALLQTARLQLGGETLLVEVAQTQEARDQGLMGRTSLAEGNGMLFVFEKPSRLTFWMKNTPIDLDFLFLDEMGVIIDLHKRAKANSFTHIKAQEKFRYVIEIPAGTIDRFHLKKGMKLQFTRPDY